MPTDVCQSAADLGYEPGSLKARIAAASEASLAVHAADLPSLPMGTTGRQWKKANKKQAKILRAQVKADVVPQFTNQEVPAGEAPPRDEPEPDKTWQPGDPAGFIFEFMTIGWLLEVVIGAVISWWVEKKLTKRFGE